MPWISDTFELHPESGVATVVLGEASSLLAALMFLWHRRCCAILAVRPARHTLHKSTSKVSLPILSFISFRIIHGLSQAEPATTSLAGLTRVSALAALLVALTSVSVHGLVGFKMNGGTGLDSRLHQAFAALFYCTAAAGFAAATFVEWRASLCTTALSATRTALLITSVATMAACVALSSGCPASEIVAVNTTAAGSCLAVTLQPSCAAAVRNAPAACVVPPALEVAAVGLLLAFIPTLAVSIGSAAVAVVADDTAAAAGSPGAGIGETHSRRGNRAGGNAVARTFDALYERTRELHAALPEKMVASVEAILFSLQARPLAHPLARPLILSQRTTSHRAPLAPLSTMPARHTLPRRQVWARQAGGGRAGAEADTDSAAAAESAGPGPRSVYLEPRDPDPAAHICSTATRTGLGR